MGEIGKQLVKDGILEKLNDRFVIEEEEWNARVQPWYYQEVDRRLEALYGKPGIDLVANHFGRLQNPLVKIVEEKNPKSQATFDEIVTFVLSQTTNTQFWIRTLLDVQDQVLDPSFPLDVSCFSGFYTDMTQEQLTGGPDGGPLDCVKFHRLHLTPRGAEIVEISNETIQLYSIDKDLDNMGDRAGELYKRLYEADRQKNLEHKVQDTVEKRVKAGPNKISNFVMELQPFRETTNGSFGLNKLVTLQAAINNKFG